ncbi:TRAP transporter large permease [Devosia sp. A8/3-2]|nr:TRAP transporter large permease [Devosia sp. A8/3-2]
MTVITLIVFLTFAALLVLNVPVAIAMTLGPLLAILIDGRVPADIVAQRMVASLDSFTLLAIPLFIPGGELMGSSSITQRLIDLATVLVGRLRGGLAHVTILASVFMSGISGSAMADAATLGKVMVPSMRRAGYGDEFAVAIAASAATMGPIIPPSIIMIVYATMVSGVSIASLFLAGILPGLLIAAALMITSSIIAHRMGFPASPARQKGELWRAFRRAALPLLLPLVIFRGIAVGAFTATEAGAIAALFAMIPALIYRDLTTARLYKAFSNAAMSSAAILLVIAPASILSWILAIDQFPTAPVSAIQAVSSSAVVMMLVVIVIVTLLGLALDGLAILIIPVPVMAPVAGALGVDQIQLALIVILCVMVGGITPPVGVLLYVAKTAGGVKHMVEGRLVWILCGVLTPVPIIAAFWPPLTLWLPSVMK